MTRHSEPPDRGRALHAFALFTAASTFFLVIAGGLVTSTGSGLAVPDWPLSYGMLFPPMVGGIFYEHGHRMIAGFVGLLTIALAVWMGVGEPRRWARRLAYLAVAAVLAQATLGGITVLYLLPTPVSVAHAGLAMAFFSLACAIAVVTSRDWKSVTARQPLRGSLPLPRLAAIAGGATYLQILVGAAVRHTGSGLACPDFPLCHGSLVPAELGAGLLLQLTHRAGGLMVAAVVAAVVVRAWRSHRRESRLLWPSLAAAALVVAQIGLGALSVWTGLAVAPTTAHVAGGALTLATLVVLALRAYRRYRCVDPVHQVAGAPARDAGALAS